MNKQKSKETQAKSKVETLMHTITFEDLEREKPERASCFEGYSKWIRVLMQNWRQGTVACKGRSDVSFSNKKPWKQKGTGRARAGSPRSPLWRGGGVTFGPQERVKTLKVSKNVKKRVLSDILNDFLIEKKIVVLDWVIDSNKPCTADAHKMLKSAGLQSEKLILFLNSGDLLNQASFMNIQNVNILFFDQSNAFDLTNGNRWVVLKKDFENFKEMVSRWN